MEDAKFQDIAKRGTSMIRAAMSPISPGETVVYNGYWRGQEVAIMGYQYAEGEHTYTKPLAILMDDDIFEDLRVDNETSRFDGDGSNIPSKVI